MSVLARVLKTARAALDLDEIWLYVAPDNIAAADGLLDAVDEAARHLARQPLMGRARPELAAELRSFPVGRYVLFYRPVAGGVELVRVLHSARDIRELDFEG